MIINESLHLVIGLGEVGKALKEVLEQGYFVRGKDIDPIEEDTNYDVLHVCLPYSPTFVETVNSYKSFLKNNGLIIIHSSVPVGTTKAISDDAVHSPVRGVHPNLARGIKTFVKFFGGKRAQEAAKYFEEIGIETSITFNADATEALKLFDTTQYGVSIIVEKKIHEWCKKRGLDFELIYTKANESYNSGYEKLGMGHVRRPVLKHVDGKIGGHCVLQNASILEDCDIADFVLMMNDTIEE